MKIFSLSGKEKLVFFLFGLSLMFLPFLFTRDIAGVSFSKTGDIGDTIGGITAPFIGFFGSILIYLALKAQIKANNHLQKQLMKQEKKEYIQNFENTFFNLLTIHHQIIENIDFNTSDIVRNNEVLESYILKRQPLINKEIKDNINLKSRDAFRFSFTILRGLFFDYLVLEKKIKISGIEEYINNNLPKILGLNVSIITYKSNEEKTRFHNIYNLIYFKINTDLGHYFRNLYRLIKMVDELEFDLNKSIDYKKKYSYTSIIRAQLSDDEIKWLFLNCLSDKGFEKFKPLLEKYTILKIIDKEDDVFKFFVKYYKESAFNNPITESDISNHVSINFYDKDYKIKNIKYTIKEA